MQIKKNVSVKLPLEYLDYGIHGVTTNEEFAAFTKDPQTDTSTNAIVPYVRGWSRGPHEILYSGRVGEQNDHKHFNDDGKHADHIGDSVTEERYATSRAHPQVERLKEFSQLKSFMRMEKRKPFLLDIVY